MRPLHATLSLLIACALAIPAGVAGAATDPTSAEEMLFIYELNLMRWNPAVYGIDAEPSPPVAVNRDLAEAAGYKADHYASTATCLHQDPIWSNRAAWNHGFPLPSWWSLDNNYIEASWCSSGTSGMPDAQVFVGSSNPAHRDLVLGQKGYAEHREIGVGYDQHAGSGAGLSVMVAPRDGYDRSPPTSPVFVTGVVYDDKNGNGRMDLGEGTSGAQVTVGSWTTTTNPGGGYSIQIPTTGTYPVSSPGAGSGSIAVGNENVGVDFAKNRSTPIVRSSAIAAERWWGDDRYETAVAVSQETHPSGADVVYVAVGEHFADAIAAGPVAARSNAPILLVRRDQLPTATRTELQRLDPKRVVIAGGPAAVSNGVESEIRSALGRGTTVERLEGATRYETAVALVGDAFTGSVATVFVATGENFPDALVAVPAAISQNAPLLLIPPNSVPSTVAAEIERLDPDRIFVLGGKSAVSSAVVDRLRQTSAVDRIDAPNRYALSAEVSQRFFDHPAAIAYIAVGDDFPDALAGGAATGTAEGPILLSYEWGLPTRVAAELMDLGPNRIVILGGPAAISYAAATEISRYIT